MRGSVTKRGKRSWRIRFDLDRVGGRRKQHESVFRGTRKEAESELARLLHEADTGIRVDPSRLTVREWFISWLESRAPDLAPVSVERYRDIIERQIIPVLGNILLQKLKPIHIRNWMTGLRVGGDRPLSARSVGHACRCLSAGLQAAVAVEVLARNPAASARPPAAVEHPVRILEPAEIRAVLERLRGDRMFPIVSLALATGLRRGELLGVRWSDISFEKKEITVERSLEQTRAGLKFRRPKNKRSRIIPIGEKTIAMLRTHRVEQLELMMKLGAGKPAPDALVFADHEGRPFSSPNYLSILWRRATKGLVDTNLHATRHTFCSALIKAGVDVVTVAARLGHHSPAFTLRVYGHLFDDTGTKDVEAIERLL